jgi:hypothetical protein
MIYLTIKQDYIKHIDGNTSGDGFVRVEKSSDGRECAMFQGVLRTIEEIAILGLAEKFGGFLWAKEDGYIILEFEDSAKAAKFVGRLGGIIDSEYDFTYIKTPIPKGTKLSVSFISANLDEESV